VYDVTCVKHECTNKDVRILHRIFTSHTHTMQARFVKDGTPIPCGGTITAGDVLSQDFVPPAGFQMVIEAGELLHVCIRACMYVCMYLCMYL
jgi:hypothetical protein